jgi:hypothetical protein
MFCAECGKPVTATAKHCVHCGTPVVAVENDAGPQTSPAVPPAPPARVAATPPPVPPAPYGAPPPPPVPGYRFGTPPPPLPAYAAAAYPGARAACRSALGLRLAAAGCFLVAFIGSFLPFMTAAGEGGDADDASNWFMLWRDHGWGPVIAVLIILALILAVVPRRETVLAAAVLSLPPIALIPIRGNVYHGLEALGISIGFGVGFFLLLAFTVVGCVLCFVAFARMLKRAA